MSFILSPGGVSQLVLGQGCVHLSMHLLSRCGVEQGGMGCLPGGVYPGVYAWGCLPMGVTNQTLWTTPPPHPPRSLLPWSLRILQECILLRQDV